MSSNPPSKEDVKANKCTHHEKQQPEAVCPASQPQRHEYQHCLSTLIKRLKSPNNMSLISHH